MTTKAPVRSVVSAELDDGWICMVDMMYGLLSQELCMITLLAQGIVENTDNVFKY